jgi:hypothetical protein
MELMARSTHAAELYVGIPTLTFGVSLDGFSVGMKLTTYKSNGSGSGS